MQKINIANGPENASRLILGCMRMPALSTEDAAKMIETAVSLGINFFDHATCYGGGDAETRFGDAMALTDIKREDLIIQSKCGLKFDQGIFDWRKSNIIESVDGILKRPTCNPIMNTKRISPKSCTKVRMGVGAVKPMCPARIPANSTKVTPSETPKNLIFPK